MTAALDEREFRIDDARDPLRTIRGRVTWPRDAERRGPLPYVLVLHGFKGFMDWGFFPEIARSIASLGRAVVRFNFSGSGHGERALECTEERAFFENTPSRELDDVERVRAWLDGGGVPWIDARRGALLGHSLGGAVALLHAARRGDYRAVVGWASVSHLQRMPSEVVEQWRRQGFVEIPNLRTKEIHRLGLGWLEDIERNAAALDVRAACARLATPALFVHGAEDEAVPVAEGIALHAACGTGVSELEIVPRANHTFGAVHPLAVVPDALARALRRTSAFLSAVST